MTETQLLQAYAVKRDAEAFAEIVRRYQRLIFATCRRTLHHADDTDDAVQETFLRLAQKAGALRTNLGGWLHACAVHVSIDKNRRREVRLRHESAAKAGEVMNDPASELKELREHLDLALEKIEVDERELIIQRFFVGRSQAELAAEAGVTPSAITHRMNGAIEALRRNLQAMGCVAIAGAGTAALVRAMDAENASAAVPAELTRNLVKIGLSGTPAAGVAGAISFALMWKVLVAVIVLLALPLGVWLGARNAVQSGDSASSVPATEPSGAPVMTVTGNGQPEVPSVPRWQATSGPVVRAPLSGRVVDSNGKPVANAIVSVSGPYANQTLKTDGNGEYVLPRIRGGGEYRIGVTADGFLPVEPYIGASASVELSASSQARRDIVLVRGINLSIVVVDAKGPCIINSAFSFGSRVAGTGARKNRVIPLGAGSVPSQVQ